MTGELFANDVKGVAASAAGTFNWSLAFLVTSTFDAMNKTFGNGETFWLFSAFCIVGTLFVFFFVPETKGRSLVEIQRMLNGEKVMANESGVASVTVDSKF